MLTCTFFGHRDAPKEIEPILRAVLVACIEQKNIKRFYVGNQGEYDKMVQRILREFKDKYSIDYAVVLAYLPNGKENGEQIMPTLFPEGIENIPRRFAISYRNRWMVEQSDYVITYVKYTVGGAAQYQKLAKNKKKKVINIAEYSFSSHLSFCIFSPMIFPIGAI